MQSAKNKRNVIYLTCSIIMIAAILPIVVKYFLAGERRVKNITWYSGSNPGADLLQFSWIQGGVFVSEG